MNKNPTNRCRLNANPFSLNQALVAKCLDREHLWKRCISVWVGRERWALLHWAIYRWIPEGYRPWRPGRALVRAGPQSVGCRPTCLCNRPPVQIPVHCHCSESTPLLRWPNAIACYCADSHSAPAFDCRLAVSDWVTQANGCEFSSDSTGPAMWDLEVIPFSWTRHWRR